MQGNTHADTHTWSKYLNVIVCLYCIAFCFTRTSVKKVLSYTYITTNMSVTMYFIFVIIFLFMNVVVVLSGDHCVFYEVYA